MNTILVDLLNALQAPWHGKQNSFRLPVPNKPLGESFSSSTAPLACNRRRTSFMSAKATQFAWKINGLSPVQKLVLVAIADRYNGKFHASSPSVYDISRRTALSLRQVIRCISALEEKGVLKIIRKHRHRNHYQIIGFDVCVPPSHSTCVTHSHTNVGVPPSHTNSTPPGVQKIKGGTTVGVPPSHLNKVPPCHPKRPPPEPPDGRGPMFGTPEYEAWMKGMKPY